MTYWLKTRQGAFSSEQQVQREELKQILEQAIYLQSKLTRNVAPLDDLNHLLLTLAELKEKWSK